MGKKAEIKDNIWEIWKIAINAKRFLKNSFYLHKPDSKEELEYLKNSRDFHFIGHSLWRLAVIELSKLFNNSKTRDKFNISHFIKKLEKDGYYGVLGIDQSKIDYWRNQITNNHSVIEMIIDLRDKIYAHTDGPEAKSKLDTPTFEQTENLIHIIENVIQEIYSNIFDSYANVESPDIDLNPSGIIKILAADKRARLEKFKKPLKK